MQVSGKMRGVVLKARFSYAEPGFFPVTHKNVGSAGSRYLMQAFDKGRLLNKPWNVTLYESYCLGRTLEREQDQEAFI